MAKRHPNFKMMQAAVARWTEEAQARPDGASTLRSRIAWLEESLAAMGRDKTPPSFEGLTCFDVMEAQSALEKALAGMTQREAA